MNYPKTLIKTLYRSLPDEINAVLDDPETLNSIAAAGKIGGLSKEQVNNLGSEITGLLMGLTLPDNFASVLVEKLGTSKEIASKLAANVAGNIISKIPENVMHAQLEYAQVKLKELPQQAATPEVPPQTLPEVIPGQTAHEVPHVEIKKPVLAQTPVISLEPISTSLEHDIPAVTFNEPPKAQPEEKKLPDISFPQSNYKPGEDPYHEPLG